MVKSDLIIVLFILILAMLSVLFHYVVTIQEEMRASFEQDGLEHKEHQDWLFNSLYSMNSKVVLPPDHQPEETPNVKSKVYSPYKDPEKQLEGKMNDWHG